MRVYSLVLSLLLLTMVVSPASAGVISYWNFDNIVGTTVPDLVGGNNGTVTGTAPLVAGKYGNAIDLRAAGNWVDFGNPAAFNFGAANFSISFWLNTLSEDQSSVIVGKHRATVVAGYLVGLNSSVGCYGAADKSYFYTGVGVCNSVPISTTTVNDGAWHFIAAVRSGGSVMIYVDGGPAEDTRTTGNMTSTTAPLRAGAITSGSGTSVLDTYSGLLDDLRIYDSALSPAEVQSLYDGTIPEPATVGLMVLALAALAAARRKSKA